MEVDRRALWLDRLVLHSSWHSRENYWTMAWGRKRAGPLAVCGELAA
jgi:hypothetical protein